MAGGSFGPLARLRRWARTVRRDVIALYLAAHDPRVPWYAKALAACTAAYALSPIDLIPDFVPVIGYLDDMLILQLAIVLTVRLVPPEIMAEHRAAAEKAGRVPRSRAAAAVVIILWTVALGLTVRWGIGFFGGG